VKLGFARSAPLAPPTEIKPEPVALPTPLKVPPPEGKPWWIVVVAIGVIGLVVGVVVISFASGARTFNGGFALFPILMVVGVLAMLFGGRFGGGGQQMSRGKMDALRARFLLMIDELRGQVDRAADHMDANYRWYHPPVQTLEASLGGPRMWERSPAGSDQWFGVARVGVGMTSLTEAGAVNFAEPQDMPTEIEMEPATGKALQEFVRYQSVAYRTPALISLLVEPGYRVDGDRERVLALIRAIICQLAFSHGPDHVRLMVVTDDVAQWDWVKWLPHAGDPRVEDAAGPVRMVYRSVADFSAAQHDAVIKGRSAFSPRHAAKKDPVSPLPHTVVVSDITDSGWYAVTGRTGTDGVTFFDLRGGVPTCGGAGRMLRVADDAVIEAVPRDAMTWAAYEEDGLAFFALADQLSLEDAERFAQTMARWRLAEPYEDIDDGAGALRSRPHDICAYYGIDDAANIDFDELWSSRSDINSDERLRIPFANRTDTGELLILDLKDMNDGGDGPHGVMSGTTGSGKTTALRTVIEAIMLGHPPQNVQMVLADCKGGSGVKPFEGTPHVANVITDLESDQGGLIDRFVDAMWGEIARRKEICNAAGADDAKEYNLIRAEEARKGVALPPLPALIVVVDEFKEFFKLKPDAQDVLDQICRQGRSYWVHLLMASQDIDTRAEKLLENVGYRLVLRANTAASAAAAGVPSAVNLPREVGLGYMRLGPAENLTKFRTESLWRDYHKPGARTDDVIDVSALGFDYLEPQLFTTDFAPLPQRRSSNGTPAGQAGLAAGLEDGGDDDEDDALRKPKVGLVIRDQLRQINFEPYRLWRPPLDEPRTIDDLVELHLSRPWQTDYAAGGNLVFPVGLIDRPYKHDQRPLVVDAAGEGSNVLVIGGQGSGKTTTLQSLICAAAMTHTPEQVQFYCLALSSAALGTVAGLPHVGGVAYALDEDGIRRTVAELLELLRTRMRSFPACGVTSVEEFRRRKFGTASGGVPDDPYGDVFLVIDNYAALTDESSTLRGKEQLAGQINKLITDGRSFGIHTIASVSKNSNLYPTVREAWPQRIELRLASEADTRSGLKARELAKVPGGRPGRGMVMQDYPRQGVDPVGLHTLMGRPALRDTDESVFDSSSVVAAVARQAARWRPAPPVRRLPSRVELAQIRSMAAERARTGMVWALDEFAEPVSLDGRESPFLVITGRARSGRTTAAAALMSEIARVYAPGSSRAPAPAADARPQAQVWLVTPDRQLLKVLPESYVERFAYRADDVKTLASELSTVLAQRLPEKGLSMAESLTQRWSGPEIFLIVDDSEKLPPGLDAPLHPLAGAVNAADDVGLRVIYTRRFGGWAGGHRADPLLAGMLTANAPLLVMDSDPDEGFVRGRWKGHDMPAGRGFLMITAESGRYVQVGLVPVDRVGS
jgi:type VII secretion protein EccCa/type VII secretion protein EccCb